MSATSSRRAWEELVSASILERKIRDTVNLLAVQCTAFKDVADLASNFAQMLSNADASHSEFVDPSLELADAAEKTRNFIKSCLPQLQGARHSVDIDTQLNPFQRRKLASSFDEVIDAVRSADAGFETLIAAVTAHDDAVADAKGIVQESVEDVVRREHGDDGILLLSQMRASEGNSAFTFARARENFLRR